MMNQPHQRRTLWRIGALTPAVLAPIWIALNWAFDMHTSISNVMACVLAPLLAVSAYTDSRWRIIPNFATYTAIVWALAINGTASVVSQSASPAVSQQIQTQLGAIGIGQSLLGMLACFTIMLVFYNRQGFGGGDLKIAAALGALLGWQLGISILFWCAVSAAAFGLFSIARQIGPITLLSDLVQSLGHLAFRAYFPPTHSRLAQTMHTPIPMGVFFVIGTTVSLMGYTVL
ncbi:MAG: prepilin peptidase [Planctomycetaceae bacterium]|mgnify:CR=1 FL=1|nr:prepilin peptidase [Planctomycetaceae bacterium]